MLMTDPEGGESSNSRVRYLDSQAGTPITSIALTWRTPANGRKKALTKPSACARLTMDGPVAAADRVNYPAEFRGGAYPLARQNRYIHWKRVTPP